jgi:arylsulfatase A-like enzyme
VQRFRDPSIRPLCLTLLFGLTVGCSSSGSIARTQRGKAVVTPPPASAVTTSTEPTPEESREPPAPLTTPAAYHGDLGLERITEPMEVRPVEGSSVLLIVIDALNAKHLGAYGYERPTTPHIDALAREGVILTNYFSTSSWTRPSMASIVTGLPKRDHKMELNCPPLDEAFDTLAERFKAAGFHTAGFVGNPLVRAKWGFGQGYDTYVDAEFLEDYGLADDADLARRAASWIKKQAREPFFALVFFTAPHCPYKPPAGFRRFFKGLPPGHIIGIPKREYPSGMKRGDRLKTIAAYDGDVLYADTQVGRLIAALRKRKLLERTHVVVTADHGEMFGEHNCFMHGYHMWDPVLRVPFVISSPSIPGSGMYDDRPFSHVDVIPTLLDLAGIDPDPELPGESIVEGLADPSSMRERVLFSQHNAHAVRREAIRKGRYKLVHHHPVARYDIERLNELHPNRPVPDPEDLPTVAWDEERYELYDMTADPGELENLYEERKTEPETAELVGELAERLEGDDEVSIEVDDDLRKALEALGYYAPTAN